MITTAEQKKMLVPGSSGWTCDELDRPDVEAIWDDCRYELSHGVIADMGPMHFTHGQPLSMLAHLLYNYFESRDILDAEVGVGEIDLQLDSTTRYRADGIVLMPADIEKQKIAQQQLRPGKHPMGVIVVPPTIVIESISLGHATRDRINKKQDYARFGVPNYWIVDAYEKSFETFVRDPESGEYHIEFNLKTDGEVCPAVFPELVLPLKKVFK